MLELAAARMTDRIHSITVVLEHDMRDDDIEPLLDAIRMLRHVQSVTPNVADYTSHMAEQRALEAWRTKLHDLIYPPRKP